MALIILGHPNLEKSIANKTIIEELQNSGVGIEIRHLQKMYPDYKIDVKEEQAALLRHKSIVLQYPIYWYSMPAILKHWFDVVLDYQFAYGPKGDKLKHKNLLPSFTVGSIESKYTASGEHRFPIHEFCRNIQQSAYYTKMNYIDPIYFHGTFLSPGFTNDHVECKAKNHAKKLLEKLNDLNRDYT
ncbi:MAG: NAD(P)H-dependent oxidoreductase [Chitinophagaceae bacterium]